MGKGKRLVFVVEGDCELVFVEKMLIPYLILRANATGWFFNAQKITTNRRLNKKGGNVSYAYLKNELCRIMSQGDVWITTLLDFFRLPNDFPGYTSDSKKIDETENAIREDVGYERFIPYIQRHEFETLLFSSFEAFEFVVDDESQLEKIRDIIDSYDNIEDINGGTETAPSKRLMSIFPYNKTVDSLEILSMLDVDTIREKCPRFNVWMEKLLTIID